MINNVTCFHASAIDNHSILANDGMSVRDHGERASSRAFYSSGCERRLNKIPVLWELHCCNTLTIVNTDGLPSHNINKVMRLGFGGLVGEPLSNLWTYPGDCDSPATKIDTPWWQFEGSNTTMKVHQPNIIDIDTIRKDYCIWILLYYNRTVAKPTKTPKNNFFLTPPKYLHSYPQYIYNRSLCYTKNGPQQHYFMSLLQSWCIGIVFSCSGIMCQQ